MREWDLHDLAEDFEQDALAREMRFEEAQEAFQSFCKLYALNPRTQGAWDMFCEAREAAAYERELELACQLAMR
jgi:hypothetical protein